MPWGEKTVRGFWILSYRAPYENLRLSSKLLVIARLAGMKSDSG